MDAKEGFDYRVCVLRARRHVAHLQKPVWAALRIALGAVFAQSGWGKFQRLERTAGYFDSLGIPVADFHAVLVANVEFVAGSLLVLGLFARLSAVPLAVTMVVAIVAAQLPDVQSVLDFITLDEFLYLGLLLLVVGQGPGPWSLDRLLARRFLNESQPSKERLESSAADLTLDAH